MRALRTSFLLALVGAGLLSFSGTAMANLASTGPTDPASGFPAWYQDINGTQLAPCVADPGCPNSPAAAAFVAPDGEAFYQLASATVNGPGGQSATVEFNLEAAFLGPAANDQITFGRVQVTLNNMVPNGAYTVTYPYGTGTWTAGPTGGLVGGPRAAQRRQVGCAATPCDFDVALGTEIGPFLQWDPAESAPPTGYIGNGVTPHTVVGPTTNFVRVEGPGLPVGGISTNLFTIEGKVASAPAPLFFAAPGSGDFGTQRVGTTVTRTVTVKNNGLADLPLSGATVSGSGDFSKGADGCNQTLASGATCTVDVSFHAASTGSRTGQLVVNETSGPSHSVPLSGAGGLPGVSTSPGIVNFLNQNVGTTSSAKTLTVGNSGSVPLNVSGATISGPNAAEFAIGSNACTAPVPAGGSCAIALNFLPGASGTRNATLTVSSDAAGSPNSVPLTGNGTIAAPQPVTTTTIIQQIPAASAVSQGPAAPVGLPDLSGPRLTLTLPKGGAKLAGSGITFTLKSDETGLATVGGSIGQRGSSRLFKLRTASRTLTKNRSTTVTVRVPLSALSALRRALGQHRVVQIHLTIKAVDPAGNARTLTRTLRVRSA
jgi:hypothetical protein